MQFGSWCIQTTKEHWFAKGSAWVGMGRESFWLCWSTKLSSPRLICVEISYLDELWHSLESPHWFQWVLAPLSKPDSAVVTEITEFHKDLLSRVHFWSELSGAGLTRPSQPVLQPRLQRYLHPSPPIISSASYSCSSGYDITSPAVTALPQYLQKLTSMYHPCIQQTMKKHEIKRIYVSGELTAAGRKAASFP